MKGENPEFLFRFTDEKKLRIGLKKKIKKVLFVVLSCFKFAK